MRSSSVAGSWTSSRPGVRRATSGYFLNSKPKVFHSFRHLFKHVARQCGIEEQVSDALSGHGSKKTEGRKYGGLSYPEEPLFEGMKQFKIAGLDLSHLYLSSLRSQ